MRTEVDILRSLKKYVALALGNDWEVRLTAEEGAFRRPFCRVAQATPAMTRVEGARMVRSQQTFTLYAYPIEKGTPDEARLEASRIEGVLLNAFAGQGAHTPSYYTPSYRGHGMRIPIYNYDGIDLKTAATEGDRQYNDFARVSDPPSVGAQVDPEDELMWVVTADVPIAWTRSTAVFATDPTTVQSIDVTRELDVEGV